MISKITHPGFLILTGFVAMIIFVLTMFLSVDDSDFQLVTDDYYSKEELFQSQLDAENRATEEGTGLDMKRVKNEVIINIPSELNDITDSLTVYFYNISTTSKDKLTKIPTNEYGVYQIDCSFIGGYPYVVTLDFVAGAERYFKKIRIN